MFSIFSNNGKKTYGIKNFIVDTPDDIDNLPKDCHPGCLAFVISNSAYFMMNHKQTWVKVHMGSGSGGSGTPVDPSEFDDDTLVIYAGDEET
jgi:hypothetical protein